MYAAIHMTAMQSNLEYTKRIVSQIVATNREQCRLIDKRKNIWSKSLQGDELLKELKMHLPGKWFTCKGVQECYSISG